MSQEFDGNIDYSNKMSDLVFTYDKDFYPLDEELPDPQIDPVIPGAKIPLQKVGIAPVDLPIVVRRRDGGDQVLQAQASLYCSLDNPEAKGLNLSRLYLLMHETIKDHVSMDGIRLTLEEMANKQGSDNAYCKLRFRYPWIQKALRSRMPLTEEELKSGNFQTLSNGEKISYRKMEGHIAYNVTLEGQFHRNDEKQFRFYLTVDYTYSSTCPCSFELCHDAITKRKAAANAHSQRSIATITVEFDPANVVWIEDVVELARRQVPTEVQVVVKRRDEQAFGEVNGAALLFSEDSVRLLYQGLDEWFAQGKVQDFSISVSHEESLHPWNAIAIAYKGIPNGLR